MTLSWDDVVDGIVERLLSFFNVHTLDLNAAYADVFEAMQKDANMDIS